MSYAVTVSGQNDISVTVSAVGQQGAAGPVGMTWEGDWIVSTAYSALDAVNNDGSSYICILAHTSAAGDEPGVGASWQTYWEVLAAAGSVSSIDVTGGTGITSSGGPITSSGAITVALDSATIASLALADSALQSGDNVSDLTNDAGYVESDPAGVTGADAITNIMSLTQAEYDAIVSPNASTLYVVTA
jgi:hypothetical protein